MPKISIIIPIYNGEKYLSECLASLVNQTFKDIEIICVNDCSKDSSLEILNSYAQKDNRIKIINQETNQGQSIGRNIGIQASHGEYIMFIDQDDWYELNTCEEAYNQIKANDNDLLLFNIRYHDLRNGNTWNDGNRLQPFSAVIDKPDIKPYELGTNIFVSSYIWCQIYKKEFLKKYDVHFYKSRQADDVPFFIKAMANAQSISIINKPFYNYRIYPAQTTSSRSDLWKDTFKSRELGYFFVKESEHADNLMNAYLVYYIDSVMYWYVYFSYVNSKIWKDYYITMQKLFKKLNKDHDISKIKRYINYRKFKNIILIPCWLEQVFRLRKSIINIRNSGDRMHKVITILWIKIKIKRHKYKH